jgi:uncharacterized protein (TIRG00374 family)
MSALGWTFPLHRVAVVPICQAPAGDGKAAAPGRGRGAVRYLKLFYLVLGLGLLGLVVHRTDLAEVAARVAEIGWAGLLVVLGVYFAVFTLDSLTWQIALPSVPLNPVWLRRLWLVRLVGEAFNSVMPAAGMGGEPVKAVLLNKQYGVGYHEGTASIVLGRTVGMISLMVFLATGFGFMLASPALAGPFKLVAGLGLLAFGAATAIVVGIQWYRLPSLAGGWLDRWHMGRRLAAALRHIRDVEDHFLRFYTRHRARFGGAVAVSLIQWFVGVLEVYFAFAFLGHPISFTDALVIEAVTQLTRAGSFFIPANLGAQEAAYLVICTAITGSPTLGLAAAIVRRCRELVWITSGFAQGLIFSVRARAAG